MPSMDQRVAPRCLIGNAADHAALPPRDFAAVVGGDGAFELLFGLAPYGLMICDDQGRILRTNARLDAKFGYDPGELVGQSCDVLLPGRYRDAHAVNRAGFVVQPNNRIMGEDRDLCGLRKDGVEFPVEVALHSMPTSAGLLVCATVVNITQRKRDERKLREAYAQMEEFTHVVSHDLRSPIRGIATLIDFIREDWGSAAPAEVTRNLDRMARRIGQVEDLIEDLMIYARAGRSTARRESIDLSALVAQVVELEAPPPGVRIVTDLPDEPLEGARTPLGTVIRNLVSNAIKHHDRDEMTITIAARYQGGECLFEIADDGPGIPEGSQERIFHLFQTLSHVARSESDRGDRGRSGSGLGLAVVQRLVEGHGGTISVTSRDHERGAAFRFSWPRYPRSELDA